MAPGHTKKVNKYPECQSFAGIHHYSSFAGQLAPCVHKTLRDKGVERSEVRIGHVAEQGWGKHSQVWEKVTDDIINDFYTARVLSHDVTKIMK